MSLAKRRAIEGPHVGSGKKYCKDEGAIAESSQRLAQLRESSLLWDDFNKSALDLAQFLLSKLLVRVVDGYILSGKIVETEAYPGHPDVASHSFKGKTERNKAMFMAAGTCYVYYIYGRQNCINVSSQEDGGAVLIRAVEPIDGIDSMVANRGNSFREAPESTKKKSSFLRNLTNGPAKLCQAMSITKDDFNCTHFAPNSVSNDGNDFLATENVTLNLELLIANPDCVENLPLEDIVTATRIGIDGAGKEAAAQPFRFYIKDNPFVSHIKK